MVTVAQINELRKATQVSMLLCKQALEATGGDFDAAKEWLRGQGGEVAGGPSEFREMVIRTDDLQNHVNAKWEGDARIGTVHKFLNDSENDPKNIACHIRDCLDE